MSDTKQPKRVNYFIHLIISVIILIIAGLLDNTYPDDFSGQGMTAILNIFGAILFLASGYKFLFYKKWLQRIENAKQKKTNK